MLTASFLFTPKFCSAINLPRCIWFCFINFKLQAHQNSFKNISASNRPTCYKYWFQTRSLLSRETANTSAVYHRQNLKQNRTEQKIREDVKSHHASFHKPTPAQDKAYSLIQSKK